jgi:HK97 family phage major capsid protein
MSLTRTAFFARIGAIAVGSVLATRPQFKSRMWFVRPPTFAYREFSGVVYVSDELLTAACRAFVREMDRENDQFCADLNRLLLKGSGNGTPKGFLNGA